MLIPLHAYSSVILSCIVHHFGFYYYHVFINHMLITLSFRPVLYTTSVFIIILYSLITCLFLCQCWLGVKHQLTYLLTPLPVSPVRTCEGRCRCCLFWRQCQLHTAGSVLSRPTDVGGRPLGGWRHDGESLWRLAPPPTASALATSFWGWVERGGGEVELK